MDQFTMPAPQEQALRSRPHLAFVIECLGLASIAGDVRPHKLMLRLKHCLKLLVTNYTLIQTTQETSTIALTQWLNKAHAEFDTLSEPDFVLLLSACTGNTMPDWFKVKVGSELGTDVSTLITVCLEC